MERLPIVLLHGYSASERDVRPWRKVLERAGYDPRTIHLGDYVSQSNEITIKDIAEGFDRALREQAGLSREEHFDAIVHSTGGLVIREWLATYGSRQQRLKRLVGLAPANFGSPLAHRGQSWMSAVFKGERELGPDFMETGHRVLSGLELGSRYTWELAHRDLLGKEPVFDESPKSPFPFVLIGDEDYGTFKRLFIGDPGSDGTVRWAGAALNSRKIMIDLTREPGESEGGRFQPLPWHGVNIPFTLVPGLNHGTIVSDPSAQLIEMVLKALEVENVDQYRAWAEKYSTMADNRRRDVARGRWRQFVARIRGDRLRDEAKDRWQQFVVRVVDERGDPVPDYYVEFADGEEILEDFSLDVHPFIEDESFRCFHVNLSKLKPWERTSLELRLTARSGTKLVAYHGAGSEVFTRGGELKAGAEDDPAWDARLKITPLLNDDKVKFFFPYTTTLIEIKLNREPMPATGPNDVLRFVDPD